MMNLNYHMDHIRYQIFKIILSIFKKNWNENNDDTQRRIYVNKIENRTTSKIKTNFILRF